MNKKLALSIYSTIIFLICLGFIAQTSALCSEEERELTKNEKRFYIQKDQILLSQKGIYIDLCDFSVPVQVESIACDEVGLYIPDESLTPFCRACAKNRFLGPPLYLSFL